MPVTQEELDDAAPEVTRSIDIGDFVDLSEIDPAHFDRTCYLEPDGQGAGKPYSLLLRVMQRTGRVAIGRFVMRSRQHLAALYGLARDADVKGRSEMSKQDLIEALQARTAPEERRTA